MYVYVLGGLSILFQKTKTFSMNGFSFLYFSVTQFMNDYATIFACFFAIFVISILRFT